MKRSFFFSGLLFLALASCKKSNSNTAEAKDPNTAPQASIDRFSSAAGHLQVRTATNGLPAANAPVNFDQGPFITQGFTPSGQVVQYYNFDVQPLTPAPIYVFYKAGESTSVPGQLNVIDVIPGDTGYNDFWQIYKVTVPSDYVANSVTSYQEIMAKGYAVSMTTQLVNCPVVPKGSTASKRLPAGSDTSLTTGWYRDMVVFYFNFFEKTLSVTANGQVPLAPIYVTFNINPNQPGGGPASGFKMETGSVQTHNVISAIPTDPGYSPLWAVSVYDNSSFASVNNLSTATAAPLLGADVANVNCPVVSIQ
ncbi:hypothetical protein [Dinghuibacter silviterrae]|uniref:Uncharacterized protein n=1 Tax=Dinghuibacter silviterrae TaxID=1539049 RepID=A0A4R8DMT2_9BACT|nr:hypothetical protein [Dinghuibacter silviterrae]TDW99078.1 hypothetical protein EDB95_0086 [Dinghuibacter silviterrae]